MTVLSRYNSGFSKEFILNKYRSTIQEDSDYKIPYFQTIQGFECKDSHLVAFANEVYSVEKRSSFIKKVVDSNDSSGNLILSSNFKPMEELLGDSDIFFSPQFSPLKDFIKTFLHNNDLPIQVDSLANLFCFFLLGIDIPESAFNYQLISRFKMDLYNISSSMEASQQIRDFSLILNQVDDQVSSSISANFDNAERELVSINNRSLQDLNESHSLYSSRARLLAFSSTLFTITAKILPLVLTGMPLNPLTILPGINQSMVDTVVSSPPAQMELGPIIKEFLIKFFKSLTRNLES